MLNTSTIRRIARIAFILAGSTAAMGCSVTTQQAKKSTFDAPVAVQVATTDEAGFTVFTKGNTDQRVCLHISSENAEVAVPTPYSTAPGQSGFRPESGISKVWSDLGSVVCYDAPAGTRTSVSHQSITCNGEGTATIVVQAFTPGPVAGVGNAAQKVVVTCDAGAPMIAAR